MEISIPLQLTTEFRKLDEIDWNEGKIGLGFDDGRGKSKEGKALDETRDLGDKNRLFIQKFGGRGR